VAEIELSALTRQCLDRRIPDSEILRQETQSGISSETMIRRGWIGNSLRQTPASASSACTHKYKL